MANQVFVVTRTDFGWDCVVAVYDANSPDVSLLQLRQEYPDDQSYVIHSMRVETNIAESD